jgi:hypothetical protein
MIDGFASSHTSFSLTQGLSTAGRYLCVWFI